MSVRDIRLLGDPILRRECDPVDAVDDEVRALIRDLEETMYDADGIGLAAPQVGVPLRVFVYDVRDPDDPRAAGTLVNPRVVSTEGIERDTEGCLSVPGLQEVVERPARVVVEGLDGEGQDVRIEADGLLARCLQHERDHLDGVLFLDRVSPIKRRMLLDRWSKLNPEEAESSVAL